MINLCGTLYAPLMATVLIGTAVCWYARSIILYKVSREVERFPQDLFEVVILQ